MGEKCKGKDKEERACDMGECPYRGKLQIGFFCIDYLTLSKRDQDNLKVKIRGTLASKLEVQRKRISPVTLNCGSIGKMFVHFDILKGEEGAMSANEIVEQMMNANEDGMFSSIGRIGDIELGVVSDSLKVQHLMDPVNRRVSKKHMKKHVKKMVLKYRNHFNRYLAYDIWAKMSRKYQAYSFVVSVTNYEKNPDYKAGNSSVLIQSEEGNRNVFIVWREEQPTPSVV